ncbi:hypothetical protein ABBQ38_001015 [Trebouxia sp. C0009 RCD-2024]
MHSLSSQSKLLGTEYQDYGALPKSGASVFCGIGTDTVYHGSQAPAQVDQATFKLNDAAAEDTASPLQESDGIKAYRQASAVPASTTSDVLGPVLSASSFTDKPASSTELQIQPTAIESAQSAPRLVTAGIEKSKKLPTVPLSQVPLNIQQILAFAPVQSEPAVSYEATLAASAATETLQTHDASQIPAQDQAMALRSLQGSMNGQSQQHVELDSATMANQSQQSMAAVKSASNVLPPDSMTRMEEAQTSHTDGTVDSNLMQAPGSRLQAITPEDSFASASGFYSPRSQMASRQQSASSSDAWFDAHSQMASRASSVSAPGSGAAPPSATHAGSTGRGPLSSTRRSTRDLIGSLRQQAGLPSPTAQLLQPHPQGLQPAVVAQLAPSQAQQRTMTAQTSLPSSTPQLLVQQAQPHAMTVQAASHIAQTSLTAAPTLQQQGVYTSMPTLVQQPLSAANPAYDLSVESSEAHAFTEPLQSAAGAAAGSGGQAVLPQSALMELVSNPLYARSLDVSRTTSTSPARLNAEPLAKQSDADADSLLPQVPTGSAIVQVSDQPILSATAGAPGVQASGSARQQAEEAVAGHLPQSASVGVEDTSAAMLLLDQASQQAGLLENPAVLQVTDQPILAPGPAVAAPRQDLHEAVAGSQIATPDADRVVAAAAAPKQMSDQPILASTDAFTAPAEDQAVTAVPDSANEPSKAAAVTDSGTVPGIADLEKNADVLTVSNQPILGETASSTSQAVRAEPVHVVSSQPLLGPVTTQTGHADATALAMPEAPPSTHAIFPEEPAQTLRQMGTESTPVMSSQPQLGPVLTQPGDLAATPLALDCGPLASPTGHVEISQQPPQPVRHVISESASVMPSQPLLGPEPAQPQAPPSHQQVQLVQQQQVRMQRLSSTESITASQHAAGTASPATQVSMEPQGSTLRPPIPGLPSVRRSRSDVRFGQQAQPGSIRRSTSFLPPTPESDPNTPQRPSPMPQLRRSVTSMPTSPVPQFPRTVTASQPQLQQVVLQQAPLTMLPPHMDLMAPLGPLQQGIAAAPAPALAPPPQQQAYDRSWTQPPSQPPPAAVLSTSSTVLPQAAAPPVDPQEVHLTVTSSPHAQQQPLLDTATVTVEQQGQPAVLQEPRFLQPPPQQPEAAMDSSQYAAVDVSGMHNPGSPLTSQQAVLEPQVTQVLEASPARQHSPPVFMRSFDASTPGVARPLVGPSPQIMRTNTWSPSPSILQPALPGQAGAAQSVQGPLSMGVQQSWSNPIPSLPAPEAPLHPSPPIAKRDYSYSSTAVPSSNPAQQVYAYPQSPPLQQADSAYGRSMPTSSTAPGYAPNPRAYPTATSAPLSVEAYLAVAPAPMAMYQQPRLLSAYPAAASATMAMYQQPGPLSGGLAQQTGAAGSRQPLRQQASMSSRTVPPSLTQGSVIQPMQGPVVVGEQSAAVTTEPMLMHSQGFSIQPLNPGQQGTMQSNMGLGLSAAPGVGVQAGSPGQLQQQSDAARQGGGGIARRILQDFGRSSRSSFNAGASVSTSYQSDRSLQQAYAGEPQRAESPPTPAVPPVSYFLTKEPVVTSYITPLPQPVPMPGPAPPVFAPMQQGYAQGSESSGAAAPRSQRGPAFPAHLRSAVPSMQGRSNDAFSAAPAQRAPAPPPVLPRVAAQAPWQPGIPSWHANSPAAAAPPQSFGYEQQQQQPGQGSSQDSSSNFRFLPGQAFSQDSQSTPSLSNRSVPKFLEDSWARGEPQPSPRRQPQAPPAPPPPPGAYTAGSQGVLSQRRSLAANALASWNGRSGGSQAGISAAAASAVEQGPAASTTVLQEEPSLYQSPLSHQSVSSFGSPSPRPAAPTPTQVTPNTPIMMSQQPPDSRNALLTSIAKGQFHLRKMSHSFEPKGMAVANDAGTGARQDTATAQPATLAALPPAGSRPRRRNSGSTTGMEAMARRAQGIRASFYPESTAADSDSDWDE